MLLLQSLYERYAIADLVGFELEKVQTSAQFYRAGFVGEVDELGEGASDLPLVHQYPAQKCLRSLGPSLQLTSTATWLTTVV